MRDPERGKGLRTPAADRLPVRKDIDLLATIEQADSAGSFASKSFGNILELGGKSLILECSREFETETPIRLSLVFPGQPRGDNPFARLHCVVRKVHDWPNLHFDVEIVDMDEDTRRRLELYLSQQSPSAGTPARGGGS